MWYALVSMTQMAFREGHLPAEMTQTTTVLLPKLWGDYRGIGVVEVICNMVTTIISARLRASVSLHNSMHGFQRGGGPLEAKLAQHIAFIYH